MGYYDENEISLSATYCNTADRNTSGLVLVAKHRHIHYLFSKAQQQGRVTRDL